MAKRKVCTFHILGVSLTLMLIIVQHPILDDGAVAGLHTQNDLHQGSY